MTDHLEPIGLGLGAALGYSGDDLTNPRGACLRGEMPYLPVGASPDGLPPGPLEMRIHGVGGAPPEENVEAPATLQVSGDGTAGFYRPWYPGGRPQPGDVRREAYCWGKLNYRSATRALWLLLLSFMIVNVAHWSLPADRPAGGRRNAFSRGLLRLLGLAMTAAFVGTATTILADMVAYQAPRRGALPSWLRSFARLGVGPRLAIGLLVVLAVVGLLFRLSLQTARSYEKWDAGDSSDAECDWALTARSFWRGERTVVRQRYCHVMFGCAQVIFVAVIPDSAHEAVRVIGVVVATALALLAVGLVLSAWTDRERTAGSAESASDVACRVVTLLGVGAAVGFSASRFWWRPVATNRVLAGSHSLIDNIVFAQFVVIIVLAVVLWSQRPWRQPDVMGKGMAAVLLGLLAVLISTIFSGALTLTIANLLGSPQSSVCTRTNPCARDVLYLSSTVYAGGIGMVVSIVSAALFGAWALWRMLRRRTALTKKNGGYGTVPSIYPGQGGRESIRQVAGTWASSSLTDLSAVLLTSVAVPTAIGVAAEELYLVTVQHPVAAWLQALASFGGTLGVLATGYFLIQLRSALLTTTSRKRFGFLWDVGTFWPRACHPFAPPCYAERSVPEVVTRIRRVMGDVVRGTGDPALAQQRADLAHRQADDPREAHSPVLVSGYSQGSPIAVAVVAQLPRDVLPDVALLTLAAPVRRLYGRTFPAYFGPVALEELRARLTTSGGCRWRNLVRRSDYIGGWALTPPVEPPKSMGGQVDHEILDPPTLWADDDPTPPPTHRHSDLFPDPQTRPYAATLAALLPARPDPAVPVPAPTGAGGARR
jgi:hypothetical protein